MHPIRDIENLIHHHPEGEAMTDQATETSQAAEPKTFAQDAEDHVKQMIAWGQRFIDSALPAVAGAAAKAEDLAAEVAKWQENPVVALLEKAALTPTEYTAMADIVNAGLTLIGKAAQAVAEHADPASEPVAPETPAQPVVAGGQPQ